VRSLLSALVVSVLLWAAPVARAADAITPQSVKGAVEAVSADPLLGGERTVRRLRWKSDPDPDEPAPTQASAPWIFELMRWMAESARVLVWLLGAAAVGIVLVLLRRWIKLHAEDAGGRAFVLPSHVRDLDIRPESLPGDIGLAARQLWLRGEQRAALSLLYRGALSRLVHDHALPIRAASTEGECVQIASRILPEHSSMFFARLVRDWQIAVYGAHTPETASVLALCDEFDRQLPAAAPSTATAIA
jgi:hypothetical protein